MSSKRRLMPAFFLPPHKGQEQRGDMSRVRQSKHTFDLTQFKLPSSAPMY
jgi:hypothetical protein